MTGTAMKLLCIGKSGQVARALAERSARTDIACICLGRPELDLLDAAAVAAALDAERPDVVVNAAAYTNVDGAESEQDAAYALNADAPGALARLCDARAIPLIHISTDYVFDGSGTAFWTEDDPTGPINVYGASKLAGEDAVRAATAAHIILRTSWVYSPFGNNFAKTMLRLAKDRPELSVVDDQIGAPTGALEIADAILVAAPRLLTQPDRFGTYHFAAADTGSWADFAAEVFAAYEAVSGKPTMLRRIPTSDYTTPAKRPANSRLDTQKFRTAFGYEPADWRSCVRAVVQRLLAEDAA